MISRLTQCAKKSLGTALSVAAIANDVVDKVKEAFSNAYEEAEICGIYLAHLIKFTKIFEGALINLHAFSLGTVVI